MSNLEFGTLYYYRRAFDNSYTEELIVRLVELRREPEVSGFAYGPPYNLLINYYEFEIVRMIRSQIIGTKLVLTDEELLYIFELATYEDRYLNTIADIYK